jgi:hypothetical protein
MSTVSSISSSAKQSSSSDCIDFDLQVEDYSKVTVLVRSLNAEKQTGTSETDCLCDVFSEKECHHATDHHLELDKLLTAAAATKCHFCQFVEHLKSQHSHVNILQSGKSGSPVAGTDKQHLVLRYRHSLTSDILDWCDFQPWRSPYALFAHVSCASKEDILVALEAFEQLKIEFKKTVIVAKLFIDIRDSKGQMDSALNERMRLLNANAYNVSTLNIEDEIKKTNFIIEKNLSNFSFNRNSSIFQFDLEAAAEKQSRGLNRNASIFQTGKAFNLVDAVKSDLVLSGWFFLPFILFIHLRHTSNKHD